MAGTLLCSIALLTLVCVSLGVTFLASPSAKRSYFVGALFWSRAAAFASVLFFVGLLTANVVPLKIFPPLRDWSLAPIFSSREMVVLLFSAPLFFSPVGNLLAAGCVAYILQRLYGSGLPLTTDGPLLMLAATTILTVSSDKMVFNRNRQTPVIASQWREFLVLALTAISLVCVFVTLTRAPIFRGWLAQSLRLDINSTGIIAILGLLSVGWTAVGIGSYRLFALPLLCLPTLLVMAFVTHWPNFLLVVPFILCVCLCIAGIDRRFPNT